MGLFLLKYRIFWNQITEKYDLFCMVRQVLILLQTIRYRFHGRVNKRSEINDINENIQDEEGHAVDERQSRKEFRKWENTKFISRIRKNNRALNSYEERLWGISIVSKERLATSMAKDLNFGVVITLREINGINRIQDFITACTLRGWIINEIKMENRLTLYHKNQEEIILD